ncbi:MAG: DUF2997 domain-containing protein [Chroococcales cyanobacterium]
MTQPIIKITITPNQPMKVEVENATGTSCTELTQPLVDNGTLVEQNFKQEYFDDPTLPDPVVDIEF